MVNIATAARNAANAYAATIALGRDTSYPLPQLANEVSAFFLPNSTSFVLGSISIPPSQEAIAENFVAVYSDWRDNGPGTDISVTDTRVDVVSDQSAFCWLTFEISPKSGCGEGWNWVNVYGFRLVDGGIENGQEGGWELTNADNEAEQYAKHFPDACK